MTQANELESKAFALLDAGEFAEAIVAFREALFSAPPTSEKTELGLITSMEVDEVAFAKQIVERHPESGMARRLRVRILLRNKLWAQAIDEVSAAIQLRAVSGKMEVTLRHQRLQALVSQRSHVDGDSSLLLDDFVTLWSAYTTAKHGSRGKRALVGQLLVCRRPEAIPTLEEIALWLDDESTTSAATVRSHIQTLRFLG